MWMMSRHIRRRVVCCQTLGRIADEINAYGMWFFGLLLWIHTVWSVLLDGVKKTLCVNDNR